MLSVFGVTQLSVLAAGAPTHTGEARGGIDFARRDVFIWVCAIIILNQLLGMIRELPLPAPDQALSDFGAVGVFQLMAWFAIFRLLALSDPAPVARFSDFLIAAALCSFVLVPSSQMIWVTALGVAIFASIFNRGDPKLRAAGIVLAALSVQEFWGRIFFKFFILSLLRAETAVVGTMLQAVRAGTQWRDNVIIGPSGHGIAVYDGCSSFHNLSLAALCWLTVRSLHNERWSGRDFVTGCLVAVAMILCNVTRLCLMAWDDNLYRYWHDGAGSQIFGAGAAALVLVISLYRSRSTRRAI